MKVLVIGAGASGLIAAFRAAAEGCETLLLEKNEKAGKKIYITGKGRCNLTNACETDEFLRNVVNGSRFMMSSLRAFGPADIMELMERYGCHVKTERGNRVFPVTDHASDVTKALVNACKDAGVKFSFRTEVTGIEKQPEAGFTVTAVSEGKRSVYQADKVIVCTGGKSYPSTGSTGDGYRFAEKAGHTVTECIPSLTAFVTEEDTAELAGVSLKNIRLTVLPEGGGKILYKEEGELLFTHRGISGPLVLTASALLNGRIHAGEHLSAEIDLKPALDERTLDARLLRDFENSPNADIGNVLSSLLIGGIRQEVLRRCAVPTDRKVHDITKKERELLRRMVKGLSYKITGTGGFEEAVITRGGISLKELNPKTMESKLVPGLFFAGEVLDIDAFTGGFNLQLAWSTGYAAGQIGGNS